MCASWLLLWCTVRFDVSGYPTIKVFTKGEARDYEGERSAGARSIRVTAALSPQRYSHASAVLALADTRRTWMIIRTSFSPLCF